VGDIPIIRGNEVLALDHESRTGASVEHHPAVSVGPPTTPAFLYILLYAHRTREVLVGGHDAKLSPYCTDQAGATFARGYHVAVTGSWLLAERSLWELGAEPSAT